MACSRMTMAVGAALLALLGLAAAQPQGGPQRMEPPKWLPDDGKDLFNDLEAEEDNYYGDASCETREKLLKHMAGKGDPGAADHRARVLLGLGLCEFRKGEFAKSKKRLDSTISEMNLPSEDYIMQNPGLAPIGLMKQAADFMLKYEVTQAGTALRRCREVVDRNLKKVLKMVHKQMGQQGEAPPLDNIVEELPGYGKTGQLLPMIKKQVPMLKQDLAWAELVDGALDTLDSRIAAIDKSQKSKRTRLDAGKAKAKGGGTLLYARALAAEPVVPAERLAVAQELKSIAKTLASEASGLDKGGTLLKRSKEGSGCKSLPETCEALQKVADLRSNGFGETRLLIAKSGKKQSLETCSTNANLGILLAAKDGASVSVAGAAEPVKLAAGEPVVFDFCREGTIEADATTPVLFAQAWHPEFAAVERTTELRARSKAFGLSEDDVKAVTKVVNDHAKKSWEKSAKQWRENSAGLAELKAALQGEADEKARQEEEAAEAKRKEEEASDEERKRNLEELQKKREAKRKAEEEKEKARLKRQKMLEEERAKRDPWLNAPDVKAAEAKIEELKEQRRDANAKLEFDLSTQLTRDISTAERQLKKAIKKARKAYKKTGQVPTEATAKSDADEADEGEAGGASEVAALKRELQRIKEQKEEASKKENFKEAKRLKKEQKELEEKIAKLEL